MTASTAHPPAPNAFTEIVCASCGRPANSARSFCGGCGARLWEPCLACETRNSVAERFCSQCGGDLGELFEVAASSLDERLRRAAELEQAGQLLEAAKQLADLPASDHSQLAARLKDAAAQRTKLENKRCHFITQRQAILAEAQRLRDEHDYAGASALLEKVPAALRDQSVQSQLSELAEILKRIGLLRCELRDALKARRIDDLKPVAEQLLALEPRADDVRLLCEQLRQREAASAVRILKEAREAIVANAYERVDQCLARIAALGSANFGSNERKLHAAIEERAWLARQLRIAPFGDQTLLKLAARLVKLQPRDEQARKWQQEIAAALARVRNQAGAPIAPWKPPSGPSPLGALVEPVTNFANLDWDTASAELESWRIASRRHLVAAGLALHGIGAATLDLELKPSDRGSWLQRLAGGRRRPCSAAWGIDFGNRGLKCVRLMRGKDGIELDSAHIIEYDEVPTTADVSESRLYCAAALSRFIDDCQPGDDPLVVGFSGAQSLGRFFRLPALSEKKLQAALEFEAPNHIPLPLEQVVYAAHAWQPTVNGDTPQCSIMLVAAKKQHVELQLAPFVGSPVRVWSLQSDCVALANALIHFYRPQLEQLNPKQAIALVEVGDTMTNIVAVSPQHGPSFRTVHRGARSLNKPLVAAFDLTWQHAEQLRQQWNGPVPPHEVDRALAPAVEELTRAVRQALRSIEEAMQSRVAHIYVAGGGCEQFGLLRDWALAESVTAEI